MDLINEAKNVFDIEINALQITKQSINKDFEKILKLILSCKGKVILTGMGKPGHIATKMAATFASLGTPSFFMHPSEAQHGDLGMIEKKDIVMLMSYSGESEEVTKLMPVLKEIGSITIAITGNEHSILAKSCDYKYVFPHFEEACYMHLAPTSSTTALLVLGDALAVVASKCKNYTKEDFGLHHPAGSLGKKLLVKVKDLMHEENDNSIVVEGETLQKAIVEMSKKGLSMVSVVDKENNLKGIITDGDLRRMLEKGIDVYKVTVDDVMTKNPVSIDYRELAVNAMQKMNEKNITSLPVLDDDNKAIGAILLQDIIKAGIVR